MSEFPASQPGPRASWDQAAFHCGRCGAQRSASTEAEYLKAVLSHQEAHALFDRLPQADRDRLATIVRTVMAAPAVCAEFVDLLTHRTGCGGTRPQHHDTYAPRAHSTDPGKDAQA